MNQRILYLVLAVFLMAGCIYSPGNSSLPESRLKEGMHRKQAIQVLNDALTHYECPGYGGTSTMDLFLYETVDIEKARVIYVQSEIDSGEMTVQHFGVLENYLIPASYGDCVGLSKDAPISK